MKSSTLFFFFSPSSTVAAPPPVPEVVLHSCAPSPTAWLRPVVLPVNAQLLGFGELKTSFDSKSVGFSFHLDTFPIRKEDGDVEQ